MLEAFLKGRLREFLNSGVSSGAYGGVLRSWWHHFINFRFWLRRVLVWTFTPNIYGIPLLHVLEYPALEIVHLGGPSCLFLKGLRSKCCCCCQVLASSSQF